MNADTLLKIRTECEKIEKDPGFGKVVITFENGHAHILKPTPTIKLDSNHKK